MGHVIGYVVTADDDDEARQAVTQAIGSIDGVTWTPLADQDRFDEIADALLPEAVPSPHLVEQARRNAAARYELVDEFGALTAEQVADLAGSTAGNRRATASRWSDDGRVFSVPYKGRHLYPAFQFDPGEGAPRQVVEVVLDALPAGLDRGGWDLALWWTTPSGDLDWARPVDLIETDPDAVVAAAESERIEWQDAAPDLG